MVATGRPSFMAGENTHCWTVCDGRRVEQRDRLDDAGAAPRGRWRRSGSRPPPSPSIFLTKASCGYCGLGHLDRPRRLVVVEHRPVARAADARRPARRRARRPPRRPRRRPPCPRRRRCRCPSRCPPARSRGRAASGFSGFSSGISIWRVNSGFSGFGSGVDGLGRLLLLDQRRALGQRRRRRRRRVVDEGADVVRVLGRRRPARGSGPGPAARDATRRGRRPRPAATKPRVACAAGRRRPGAVEQLVGGVGRGERVAGAGRRSRRPRRSCVAILHPGCPLRRPRGAGVLDGSDPAPGEATAPSVKQAARHGAPPRAARLRPPAAAACP